MASTATVRPTRTRQRATTARPPAQPPADARPDTVGVFCWD
ncbi:MAG TPA: hypothetical protein VGL06_24765 [Pseudonocardiaceae bacterium]|jgi:hypothetical protein